MKTSRLLVLTALAALCCAGQARAAGASSAAFLRVGWGARPAAMGEAFTAAADDVDALYWNPAGLNYVKRLQQTFGHNVWLADTSLQHAAFAMRRTPDDVIGAGLGGLSTGDIERGNKYGYTEGYYSAGDLVLIGSYARTLKNKLRAGASFKIIRERIESESGQAFAIDAGAVYERSPRLKFGATLRNLGTGLALGEGGTPGGLPMGLRAGAALQYSKDLLLTSDLSLPFDDSLGLHFGGEYIYPAPVKGARLALRAGFKTAAMGYLGAMSAISLGFGVETGALGVDYALSPYGDLGMTHRLSLKLKFDSLTAGNDQITVERGGQKVTRAAADVYAETLQWFKARVETEKLGKAERETLLKRIIEKFSALGVDVSEARRQLGGGDAPAR
ncbi:MAG: hypothetical protein CVU79_04940 [Elusimicrobia bacterium HGW-Elusimicrobia-3]|nr:MAG: hypothetical protein CVU79_04940 [Elusimicrobia bacterium HGW-Elusimicrobia-3]